MNKQNVNIGLIGVGIFIILGIWAVSGTPRKLSTEERFSYTVLQSEVGTLLVVCDHSTGDDYLVVPQTGIEPLHGASCNK